MLKMERRRTSLSRVQPSPVGRLCCCCHDVSFTAVTRNQHRHDIQFQYPEDVDHMALLLCSPDEPLPPHWILQNRSRENITTSVAFFLPPKPGAQITPWW